MKLYLSRLDKNIAVNKASGDERLPYFSLKIIPEQEGGEWIELGACWKSKTGKGYNMKLQEGVEIVLPKKSGLTDVEKKAIGELREASKAKNITVEDINWD